MAGRPEHARTRSRPNYQWTIPFHASWSSPSTGAVLWWCTSLERASWALFVSKPKLYSVNVNASHLVYISKRQLFNFINMIFRIIFITVKFEILSFCAIWMRATIFKICGGIIRFWQEYQKRLFWSVVKILLLQAVRNTNQLVKISFHKRFYTINRWWNSILTCGSSLLTACENRFSQADHRYRSDRL